ncbi:hypothetical protein HYH02_009286 [Chlamydomonas schloesseri]|uniref:Apoptosis antagonizing transcription factor n=1 Tax=Chlamydomonas schloesseri TaxID=2026947 RepID=A0A835TD04_9CHLO|nr:hypothetical protein HYH02_009286 [Chlamydomonas schloesseri]|eukprot:KAG2443212.1 hypothetical protein HYH02_009286 [Chlamydomonas schloesseri]
MSGKRKSLRDELADLLGPAPARDHDPDALDLGDGAHLADDGDYEETRRAPTRRAPEKAMLMRGDIDLEDAAYRGRKSSRAAVFGDADDDEDDADVDLDLELGESDDEEDEEVQEAAARGRRDAAARAGPSGRAAGAAAAAAGGKGRRGVAANGHIGSGSEDGVEGADDDDDDDEGEEEGSEGDDGEDLMLAAGDEDDEDEDEDEDGATGTGTGTEDGEEDDGAAAAKAARAAAAARRRVAAGAGGGDELDALEAEYEALQEEDDAQLMSLRQKGERDRIKGLAVRNQQALYERVLEQRILLQRCLQASNGLPRPDTHAALVATQPEVREGFTDLASAARSTLSQLMELQHTLMARTRGIQLPAATAAGTSSKPQQDGKRKRDQDDDDDDDDDLDAEGGGAAALDSLWLRLSSQHEALAPYRDTALDSWHRRTVLSSGSGALRNAGLRALNQSISSQVAALMRDPAKFIKRTRLTLSACPRVLCEPARESAAAAKAADPHAAADVEAETAALEGGSSRRGAAAGVSASEARDVLEEERDAETYDDAEFYQQLLKEFLDKGMEGAAAGAPKAAKKRKLVDRRASKGRKLRYHVQEKLVAFMAPVESELPPFAAQLFSNLFGHAGH